MKIAGHDLTKEYVETLVIPRATTNIVIKAKAVLDYKAFEALCPLPEARKGTRKNKVTGVMEPFIDVEDPKYKEAMSIWSSNKVDWMILESLKATEGLEWDKVKPNNPDTWGYYAEELYEAGFSDMEVSKIIGAVTTVCGLNEDKIKEATNSFLASAVEETVAQQSIPSSEPQTTESGEPAKE